MDPINESSITGKQRHGCVTAWLGLMIVMNSLTALGYLFARDMIAKNLPGNVSTPMLITLGVIGIANVVFAVMLLRWKKFGFWGFVLTSIAAVFINLNIGLGIGQSVLGLVGVAILYGVLQLKKNDVKAWDNLE